jgi:hypothetical protein
LVPPWPTTDHAGHCQRKIRQTTHLRDVPDQVTVIRKRHAFEGQKLAVISSIKRRGVLVVLVVLPNGSRSLIPAAWTDWRDADANASVCDDDDVDDTSSLGKLDNLLQLGKVIDALLGRYVESAPHVESGHAAELGVPKPSGAAVEPCSDQPATGRLGATRRGGPDRRARRAGAHHRPHAGGRCGEGDGSTTALAIRCW